MSHEFETGFVVREQAWHGLATVLKDAPTIEAGIKEAGLEWEVSCCPMTAMAPSGIITVEGFKAVVRHSDSSVLGVVSDKYVPLQNAEAFGWFQPFLDKGLCTLESAGSLKKGKHVWVLAKIQGGDAEVSRGDQITGYLLLSTAHDGSRAVTVALTPIRVVCWNTISMAFQLADQIADRKNGRKGKAVRIVHSKQMKDQLKAVQEQIDFSRQQMDEVITGAQVLRRRKVGATDYYKFLESVYAEERNQMRIDLQELYVIYNNKKEPKEKRDAALIKCQEIEERLAKPFKKESAVSTLVSLFESGPGAEFAGKTLWGAVNAVSHYEEHMKPGSNEVRLHSSWFGGTVASNREKAFAVAAAMV
jgi:phage/plasmid-like protein (TIGR03299 family)